MKSKLLIYVLPVILTAFLLYGYSVQDDPRNDAAPVSEQFNGNPNVQSDTLVPAGFFPTKWNFNYAAIGGLNGGTVGACYFEGKYYFNRWNSAMLYRYNDNGTGGGPGTLADSISGYNGGTGAIRDMTVGPDGSGTQYLWGGAASTILYKMNGLGTRIASYTHAGAAYRAVAWDKNRKGFWSCNFAGNITCRDTNGVILKDLTNTLAGKYGLGFDSTSTADSAFLWVWSQGATTGAPNELHRIHINSNTDTRTYIIPLVGGTLGIAGGAEAFVRNNELILALNYQNFATVGYKIKDLTPTGGGTITVCRSGIWRSIPENGGNANPVVDTLTVSGVPSGMVIRKIKVKVDTVIHTWIGDLRFWLSKGSVTDTIISRLGWTGSGFGNSCDNLYGTNLADSTGLINIQNIPTTCNGTITQATGTFNPKSPLAPFINTDANGQYLLRICDNAGGDTGSLRNWCVTIEYGTPVGVQNNITTLPSDFSLSQNYPNPFNPSTKISFSIPKSGLVTLKVYDVVGKEVAKLVNEVKNAGNHEITFNATSLSSGVYFYRLESGNFVETKKMFLLK